MTISFIAAIGRNNELGKNNKLVWRLPGDLKFFTDTTKGHSVIMGRKTFESIGRVLENRRNIIITHEENYNKEGIEVVHSIEKALELCSNENEVFIIGGAQIFTEAMPWANRLYITHVDAEDKDANVFFPKIDLNDWKVISEKFHPKDDKNEADFIIKIYEKIN